MSYMDLWQQILQVTSRTCQQAFRRYISSWRLYYWIRNNCYGAIQLSEHETLLNSIADGTESSEEFSHIISTLANPDEKMMSGEITCDNAYLIRPVRLSFFGIAIGLSSFFPDKLNLFRPMIRTNGGSSIWFLLTQGTTSWQAPQRKLKSNDSCIK